MEEQHPFKINRPAIRTQIFNTNGKVMKIQRTGHNSEGDKPKNPYIRSENSKKIGLTNKALADSQEGVLDKPRGEITEEKGPNIWFDRTTPTQRDGKINNCSFHHDYNPVNKRGGGGNSFPACRQLNFLIRAYPNW